MNNPVPAPVPNKEQSMKNINHFNNFQELYTFLKAKPVEPKKYVPVEEPKEEPKPKKRKKKDAEVLQAE